MHYHYGDVLKNNFMLVESNMTPTERAAMKESRGHAIDFTGLHIPIGHVYSVGLEIGLFHDTFGEFVSRFEQYLERFWVKGIDPWFSSGHSTFFPDALSRFKLFLEEDFPEKKYKGLKDVVFWEACGIPFGEYSLEYRDFILSQRIFPRDTRGNERR